MSAVCLFSPQSEGGAAALVVAEVAGAWHPALPPTGDVTGRGGGGGMGHFGLALPYYTHFTSPIRCDGCQCVCGRLGARCAAAAVTLEGCFRSCPLHAALTPAALCTSARCETCLLCPHWLPLGCALANALAQAASLRMCLPSPSGACRRYADVVVHRQLLAAVAAASSSSAAGGAAAPNAVVTIVPRQVPPLLPAADVAEQARVMNERHRTAKRAQKECSDLYLLLLLHSQVLAACGLLCPVLGRVGACGLRRSGRQQRSCGWGLAADACGSYGFLPTPCTPHLSAVLCIPSACMPLRSLCCCLPSPPFSRPANPVCALQPHIESATVYGLRPRALVIFLPKYHLRVRVWQQAGSPGRHMLFLRGREGGPQLQHHAVAPLLISDAACLNKQQPTPECLD